MKTFKGSLMATAIVGAVGVMGFGVPAIAVDPGWGAFKLEGAWVAKQPGSPLQWSYVLSPDASGRKAALHGSIEVGFVVYPDPTVSATALLGEVVMTGPTTAKFNSVWYGRMPSAGPPFASKLVYIGVNQGDVEWKGPGKSEVTSHITYYDPTADADGDGFPDPGSTPIAGPIVLKTVDTRVPAP